MGAFRSLHVNRFATLLFSSLDLLGEEDIIGLWCDKIYRGFDEFLSDFRVKDRVNEVLEKLIFNRLVYYCVYLRDDKIKILKGNFVSCLGVNKLNDELRILMIMKK